jgi:basic membrane protein A
MDCARENVFCVGLVTAFGDVEDHGLNQAAWEALQNIETEARIARLDKIESIDTRDWEKNILFFAEKNYDVIVTVGGNLGETTVAVAREYSNTLFIGIDQRLDEEYANVATIYFAEEQAGFLAGMLAATVTEAGKVGAVCETSGIDSVQRYCEGFRAGVKYEDESVRILVMYRENRSRDDTFNDPEWGEGRALSLIDSGVDVITGFGGNTAQGAFSKAAEKGILVIGAEEDLYFRLPDVQQVLITSMINDPGDELANLVLMTSQGEKPVGSYVGRVEYAPFRGPDQEVENDMFLKAGEVLRKIENGEIEINLPE